MEDYEGWLQRVQDHAVAGRWNDVDKCTAAKLTLRGNAREWQNEFGRHYPDWARWESALSRYFVTPMDEAEWRVDMESLVQHPGETAKEYVLLKNALFRKRAIATKEVERIEYLIRGLCSSEVKAAVLAVTPATVNEFVEMVQAKERMITFPQGYWRLYFRHRHVVRYLNSRIKSRA
jgi:hypothetical protein